MHNDKPNIILIVCDTLRKDILELYGGPAKTPNLNKLAKDAMVYDNCIAPSPWTFPSHVSLFTGLYPSQHRVHENKRLKLFNLASLNKQLSKERLSTYLKKIGYTTLGVSNNIMVSRFSNFDIGFDNFFNIEVGPLQSNKATEAMKLGNDPLQILISLVANKKYNDIITYAKEYIELKNKIKAAQYPLNKGAELTNKILFNSKLAINFFLFVNFVELHEPYRGQNPREIWDQFTGIKKLTQKRTLFLKKQYINEVEYLDKELGKLIEMLKLRSLYNNAMIIITSDHGQALNEYGYMYHGNYLYDEITRVPLIIKYPNREKFRKKKGYQSLVNIPELIKDILDKRNDMNLTREIAFSESYGSDKVIPEVYKHRASYVNETYEKTRKAIYEHEYKLVINFTDEKIEEFLKNGKKIDIKANRLRVLKLVNNLIRFSENEEIENLDSIKNLVKSL